jgi:hypothetical protein
MHASSKEPLCVRGHANVQHVITAYLAIASLLALWFHISAQRSWNEFQHKSKLAFGVAGDEKLPLLLRIRMSGMSILLAIGAILSLFGQPGIIMFGISLVYEVVLSLIRNYVQRVTDRELEAKFPEFERSRRIEPLRLIFLIGMAFASFYLATLK